MNEWICWPFSLLWITGTLYRPSARTTQHHSMTLLSVTSVHLQPESAHPADGACVCVCVCEGQRCRFIPYAGVYTRTCAVVCPSACYYCHMIKILFLHAYSTCTHLYYISPLISLLHALLTDVVFVGVSRAHCGVTLYWMRSEGESCGVNGQPRLSWFMFCF